jgi:hypothetical protein
MVGVIDKSPKTKSEIINVKRGVIEIINVIVFDLPKTKKTKWSNLKRAN